MHVEFRRLRGYNADALRHQCLNPSYAVLDLPNSHGCALSNRHLRLVATTDNGVPRVSVLSSLLHRTIACSLRVRYLKMLLVLDSAGPTGQIQHDSTNHRVSAALCRAGTSNYTTIWLSYRRRVSGQHSRAPRTQGLAAELDLL